jgi:hypothetical protein
MPMCSEEASPCEFHERNDEGRAVPKVGSLLHRNGPAPAMTAVGS